jgi:hypothetical protein
MVHKYGYLTLKPIPVYFPTGWELHLSLSITLYSYNFREEKLRVLLFLTPFEFMYRYPFFPCPTSNLVFAFPGLIPSFYFTILLLLRKYFGEPKFFPGQFIDSASFKTLFTTQRLGPPK